jgi:hypothetical protein
MAILKLKAGASTFNLEIGTERHVSGADISVSAGGSDFRDGRSVFEADKGHVILEAMPMIRTQWGESSYSTSLTGRDASIEKIEKITKDFQEILDKSQQRGGEKTAEFISWVRKQVLDYYFKFTSTNAHFEAYVQCQSREIRVLGVVVDTKTATLGMGFSFRVLKLITPEEMALLKSFLDRAVSSGVRLTHEYQH